MQHNENENTQYVDNALARPSGLMITWSSALIMDPNEKQVGGDHYKGASFQPWDWARNVSGTQGLGYYEVSAIAYIARFRKKGGVQDLEKVLHYIDKMLCCFGAGEYENHCTATLLRIREFNKQNQCDRFQSEAVQFLVMWRHADELVEVKKIVEELIQCERDDQYLDKMVEERLEPYPVISTPEPPRVGSTSNLGVDWAPPAHSPAVIQTTIAPARGQLPCLVTGSGTGTVAPAEPPTDVATMKLPPYKPLRSALKIPSSWNNDNDPDKLVNTE